MALLAALLVACGGGEPRCQAPARVTIGDVTFEVPVADELAEQQRGLMGRTSLDADDGMLFQWSSEPTARSFYMKDTLIPLDLIAFELEQESAALWTGRIVSIDTMQPCDRTPCPTTWTEPANAALEINAGLARANGFEVGDRVRIAEAGCI